MKLRLIDPPRYNATLDAAYSPSQWWKVPGRQYEVGDCWYATADADAWLTFPDSASGQPAHPIHIPDVHRHAGVRPMLVVLPATAGIHCLHTSPSSNPTEGWQVVGELPEVTVFPSVDVTGRWHGWIQAGELVGC